MDSFTPFDVVTDIGWVSVLLIIGNLLRRFVPWFQHLLIPAPITAGILGLILGPEGFGLIQFSEYFGDYATILIAVVFGSLPYTMSFDTKVREGARTMWAYSVGMYLAQWGVFALLGVLVFSTFFGTPDWFGIMLPVGFVGGFGVAAAVGGALDSAGMSEATSLGFTAAAVGMFAAIVGGVIFARWGSKKGHTEQLPELSKLPEEMRTGLISLPGQRPSVGKATTSPSSIEPIALHIAVVAVTLFLANVLTDLVNNTWPSLSFPLFAMAFLVGLAGMGLMHLVKAPWYVDQRLMGSVSGASTDFLVAVGYRVDCPGSGGDVRGAADHSVRPGCVVLSIPLLLCGAARVRTRLVRARSVQLGLGNGFSRDGYRRAEDRGPEDALWHTGGVRHGLCWLRTVRDRSGDLGADDDHRGARVAVRNCWLDRRRGAAGDPDDRHEEIPQLRTLRAGVRRA